MQKSVILKDGSGIIFNRTSILKLLVFADDQIKMKLWEWALIQYDYVFIKGGNLDRDRHTQGQCYELMKEEIEVMH